MCDLIAHYLGMKRSSSIPLRYNLCLVLLRLLIVARFGASGKECDPHFINHSNKLKSTSNIYLKVDLNEDVYSYVAGFRFSKPIESATTSNNETRSTIKVKEDFWLATKKENFLFDSDKFDLLITTLNPPVDVEALWVNGKELCGKGERRHTKPQGEESPEGTSSMGDGHEVAILSAVVVGCSLLLGTLIALLIFFAFRLKKLSDLRWYQTHTLVLAIERSLSINNPNAKGVPLPDVPDRKSNIYTSRGGHYIDLQTYQCNNNDCLKTYNLLIDALHGLSSSGNCPKTELDNEEEGSVNPAEAVAVPSIEEETSSLEDKNSSESGSPNVCYRKVE